MPARPDKFCDIVMKGGITSGVVYPLAVCELAKTFRFRSVGGTSAGAIAAAATAAAELGRDAGAFKELEGLPKWLGDPSPHARGSNLFNLFQPQPATRPLFVVLAAIVGHRKHRGFWGLWATLWTFRVAALIGCVPGLVLAILAAWSATGLLLYWSLGSALLLVLAGAGCLAAVAAVRVLVHVPENWFGLCSGYAEPKANRPAALTNWLTDLLNRLAGRTDPAFPLTFGDLWGTPDPKAERLIDLKMMTTCLSHGRPYLLPFDENIFYFDPNEFRELFPADIVEWMITNPHPTDDPDKYAPLRPLPAAANLPVVVAARLSLSFPFVISAMPLYAVDYSSTSTADRRPERCWFSDGGICSNFPVHFFDRPLPRWPTFDINLRPFHPDRPETAVWMPTDNRGGIVEWWTRFDNRPGLGRFAGFLGAIGNAMQNWRDNTQTHVPGYRDRIVHVSLKDDEGGLNLTMSPDVIKSVSERGRDVGRMLVERFAPAEPPPMMSWDNHRWIRYRSIMSLIEEMLRAMADAFRDPMPGDRTYQELIDRKSNEEPLSYKWDPDGQQKFASEATQGLVELRRQWEQTKESFQEGAPRPKPELRITPRI